METTDFRVVSVQKRAESVSFNEIGGASMLARRPWWVWIPEFLAENIELSIHEFRLARETVVPADSDEFSSDNE